MANPTTISVTKGGLKAGAAVVFSQSDTANGNWFANDGNTYLVVNNLAGTGAATVTIPSPLLVDGSLAVASKVVNVPANASFVVGPFDPTVFNQAGATNPAAGGVLVQTSAAVGLACISTQ